MKIRQYNVTFRVLTKKNAQPPNSHVFKPTRTIFELVQDIIATNLQTKSQEKLTINPYIAIQGKIPRPLAAMFFKQLELFSNSSMGANLLTKFLEDWTIYVASRALTRIMLRPHATQRTKGNHKSSP
ncbi:hypothetical protein DPMN_079353 [Dreissena polymorpha]|uniref:Uncharacterized protein n=1 Tax=Dreissena polymorpha TaxID=45954 RepID=A0A9D4BSX3_DREPO|nr:hypothetical protein DPMN_079353 [Dreissena polymorpha]